MKSPFGLPVSVVAGVATILVSAPSPAQADSFTVEQWGLTVSVDNGWPDLAADAFLTPINPFIAAHQVTLPSNPATTAAAQYDFAWAEEFGQFLIAAQLAAQDGSSVSSTASGTIYLQSDTDTALTLSVDAVLDYNLPTYGLYAYLGFGVRDLTADQQLFSQSESWDSVLHPPGSGVLSITGNVLLPAGYQLRVNYGLTLDTFGASSGLATADGHVNFQITPEPSTATLLLLPLAALLYRRRMPRRRS
jgi:hypothetical protein